MNNIKVGRSQIKNPIPAGLIFWVRVFSVAAGIIVLWIGTVNFIDTHTKEILSSLLGLGIALSNGLLPLFGVQVEGKDTVKTEDVTAMEEIPKAKPDINHG